MKTFGKVSPVLAHTLSARFESFGRTLPSARQADALKRVLILPDRR
jgi:hypothetical protein